MGGYGRARSRLGSRLTEGEDGGGGEGEQELRGLGRAILMLPVSAFGAQAAASLAFGLARSEMREREVMDHLEAALLVAPPETWTGQTMATAARAYLPSPHPKLLEKLGALVASLPADRFDAQACVDLGQYLYSLHAGVLKDAHAGVFQDVCDHDHARHDARAGDRPAAGQRGEGGGREVGGREGVRDLKAPNYDARRARVRGGDAEQEFRWVRVLIQRVTARKDAADLLPRLVHSLAATAAAVRGADTPKATMAGEMQQPAVGGEGPEGLLVALPSALSLLAMSVVDVEEGRGVRAGGGGMGMDGDVAFAVCHSWTRLRS